MNVLLGSDFIIQLSDEIDAILEKNRKLEKELIFLKRKIQLLEKENDILIKLKMMYTLITSVCNCEKNDTISILYREATKCNELFYEHKEKQHEFEEKMGNYQYLRG